jgi:hypothetical protein
MVAAVLALAGSARAQSATIGDGNPLTVTADGKGGLQISRYGTPVFDGAAGIAMKPSYDDASLPSDARRQAVAAPSVSGDPAGTQALSSTFAFGYLLVDEEIDYTKGGDTVQATYTVYRSNGGAFQTVRAAELGHVAGTSFGEYVPGAGRRIGARAADGSLVSLLMSGNQGLDSYEQGPWSDVSAHFLGDGLNDDYRSAAGDSAIGAQWEPIDAAESEYSGTQPLTVRWRVTGPTSHTTVDTTGDSGGGCVPGNCALRSALAGAAPGGVVTLPAGHYNLEAPLTINRDVTIAGAGPGTTTLDGQGSNRVLDVTAGTLALSGVTVTGGHTADPGGGVRVASGAVLSFADGTISGNHAVGLGGGVYADGQVALLRSAVVRNTVAGSDDGDGNLVGGDGGGLATRGGTTLIDTTISGNSAHAQAGGLSVYGPLAMTNDTIAANTAPASPGMVQWNSTLPGAFEARAPFAATVEIDNTIIDQACSVDSFGYYAYSSVSSDPSCGMGDPVDPKLKSLALGTGSTETHALDPNSPALGAANAALCPTTDQRGEPRPEGGGCDIGAYQLARGTGGTPADTTIDSGPDDPTNNASPTFTFSSTDAGASFECRLTGDYAPCSSPETYSALADGTYTFAVRTVGGGTPATLTFTVDTIAPGMPAITGPATSGASIDLTGSAEPNADVDIFEGATPFGTATADGSGAWDFPIYDAPAGQHTYTAVARDAAGNSSAPSAPFTVTVDLAPPVPTITAPDEGATIRIPRVDLQGTGPANVQIQIYDGADKVARANSGDDGGWTASIDIFEEGTHVYTATAVKDDVESAHSAPRTVHVDLPPAEPAITFPADDGTTSGPNVRLRGTSDPDTTILVYEKQQPINLAVPVDDAGNWRLTFTPAASGSHTYRVLARDDTGNESDEAERTIDVDLNATAAPETTIVSGPDGATTAGSPAFAFSSDDPDATFECELAGLDRAYADCATPVTYTDLPDGAYTLLVRATNALGNADASPATRSFTVDTTPPDPTSVDGPDASGSAFTLSGSGEPGSVVLLTEGADQVGSATVTPDGTWTVALDGVSPGAHTYTAFLQDAAGNRSTPSAPRTVTVAQPGQATPTPTPTPAPSPAPAPTPTPTPTPLPPPVVGQSVNVAVTSGTILVKLPGSSRYVALSPNGHLPVGTLVDATNGKVRLTSAADGKGGTQSALFYGGIFKVGQTKGAKPVTELTLAGPAPSCKAKASAAPKKKPKSRKLWGDGSGSFRTRGQYSAATVRGTNWLTEDSCAGTLTRVVRGVVAVQDLVKHKTVLVKAGKHYLAVPKKKHH